jgi:hypothetical protein
MIAAIPAINVENIAILIYIYVLCSFVVRYGFVSAMGANVGVYVISLLFNKRSR